VARRSRKEKPREDAELPEELEELDVDPSSRRRELAPDELLNALRRAKAHAEICRAELARVPVGEEFPLELECIEHLIEELGQLIHELED
jgi:hypothetical protein